MEGIRSGVCRQCGEEVDKADVGRWIVDLMENFERIDKALKISVPTITFDADEAKI